jgi:nicotinamidase-related amidase
MKKVAIILTLLAGMICHNIWAQDPQAKSKTLIKPALLVIDIQNAYLNWIPEREKEIGMANINSYIELFRSMGFPVIRIYHYSKEEGPQQGTEQFEYPASVLIKPDDPRIIKTYADGFNKTDLDKILKEKGCNTLFLCGLSAVGCVLATWIGAQDHDYKAFMIKDAIMSHNSDFTNHVEEMFDAVGFEVIKIMLEQAEQ